MSIDSIQVTASPQSMGGRASQAAGGQILLEHVDVCLGHNGSRLQVLQDLSLRAEPGELVCLLGPSGCGKSTLLAAIAGHLPIAAGHVRLDGDLIDGPDPQRGLVFQQHTLFPWKTVLDNVAFGLKMKGIGRRARHDEARRMLDLVGLAGFESRYPRELSGGMQQRVELARVLVNSPRVLLMDEPFAALDALTRSLMQELLLDLWATLRTTVLFVTHDIDEAVFLADRIVILSSAPGRIVHELPVGSERPRHRSQLTESRCAELKHQCLDLLRPVGMQGQMT